MAYQSFVPGEGSSKSHAKLAALQLPDLTGKTVLDLGCNEGFFCFAALQSGATFVTGIDRNANHIASAKRRAVELALEDRTLFLNTSWDDIPAGRFDTVLLLSALHYAKDQMLLLDRIADLLNPGGLLILEAGVDDSTAQDWTPVERGPVKRRSTVHYPSKRRLTEMLQRRFAPRRVGPSVMQNGDPMPRFVYHCRKLMPTLIGIVGRSGAGKSTLARFLSSKIPVFAIDAFMVALATGNGPLSERVKCHYQEGRLGLTYRAVVSSGLSGEIANELMSRIEAAFGDHPCVAVEGALLSHVSFMDVLRQECEKRSIVLWVAKRG